MQSPIYILSFVGSICAAYFIWTYGIQKFLLDYLRERLFELRFRLFSMGMSGEVPFDDDAYRALETLFNGLIRFGHRISFLTWYFSQRAQTKAREEKDYVSVGNLIGLKVSRLQPEAQAKIAGLMKETHDLLSMYMGCSSLFFLSIAAVLIALDRIGFIELEPKKEQAMESIEREAFLAETRRGMRLATA